MDNGLYIRQINSVRSFPENWNRSQFSFRSKIQDRYTTTVSAETGHTEIISFQIWIDV